MKKCLRLVICLVIMQEICLMAGGACSTGNGNTVREPSSPRAQMYVVVENGEVGDYSQITDFQAHAAPAAVEPTKTRDSDEESIPQQQQYSPSDDGSVLINSVNEDNLVAPTPMDPEAIKKEEAVFLAASIKEKQARRGTNLSNGTLSRVATVIQSKPTSQLHWLHDASTIVYKPRDVAAFRLLKDMAGELATHREEAVEGKKDANVAPTEVTKESERPTTAAKKSEKRRGTVVVFDLD